MSIKGTILLGKAHSMYIDQRSQAEPLMDGLYPPRIKQIYPIASDLLKQLEENERRFLGCVSIKVMLQATRLLHRHRLCIKLTLGQELYGEPLCLTSQSTWTIH